MPNAEWYERMGKAMARREKCLNAITKWQAELAEVEAEIDTLRTNESPEPTAEPAAAEPETVVTIPSEWKASEPALATEGAEQ